MRIYGLVMAALCAAGCAWNGTPAGPTQHDHAAVDRDHTTSTRLELRMGGGQLEVTGGASALVQGDFTYNEARLKPTVTHTVADEASTVVIAQDTSATTGRVENHWQVAVSDAQPLTFVAHVVAGDVHLTLGSLALRGVDVSVTAGELTVDLRGRPTSSYRAEIRGGVGQITVRVPSSVAIRATASGTVGDIHVEGLEQRDGQWVNPKVPASAVTIDLNIQGGVGQINLVAQ